MGLRRTHGYYIALDKMLEGNEIFLYYYQAFLRDDYFHIIQKHGIPMHIGKTVFLQIPFSYMFQKGLPWEDDLNIFIRLVLAISLMTIYLTQIYEQYYRRYIYSLQ